MVVTYSWLRLDPFIPCFGCERDRGLGRSISSMLPVWGCKRRDLLASTNDIKIHDTSIHIYSYIKLIKLETFGGNCYFIYIVKYHNTLRKCNKQRVAQNNQYFKVDKVTYNCFYASFVMKMMNVMELLNTLEFYVIKMKGR